VVWPQALRIALPPTVGVVIGAVKDTSLVLVIGVFDLLGAAKAAVADTLWRPYALEVYLAVAGFYLAICLLLSACAERMRDRSRSRA
jgi:general L-amino acid transport system permease protein